MSADQQALTHGRKQVDELDLMIGQKIAVALMTGAQARSDVVGSLVAGLANAIAFFSGPDDIRAAMVADIVEYLPAAVERCHAEITSMRGKPQ